MKVVEIKDIEKRELPIHYRHVYTGAAVIEYGGTQYEKKLEFVLEQQALGGTDLHVSFIDDPDYPLVPAIEKVKEYIRGLESSRKLPG